ncbi:J-domain-containing protein [Amycolatopsis sp. CA-230715]|uniref:DnaJ family domain-containing protein n=1 Tax=Amycolatopsis sp. CA-230715 TaxID=2745196 RepID=UPI001C011B5C|nr:DUF1992 domain-containing protein [Amycolatopsis sp. CA-230715]QWF78453.1 hypothetical protein HUW46_01849 [Amycolatopsis sp. CA-230715]
MTGRKPPGMPYESWLDTQVRQAEERGELENLPGAGKPLPKGRTRTALEWAAELARREGDDTLAMLPPSLALAKEAELLPGRAAKERSERAVRALVTELNERIMKAYRQPQDGPPMRVRIVDADEVVEEWRKRQE